MLRLKTVRILSHVVFSVGMVVAGRTIVGWFLKPELTYMQFLIAYWREIAVVWLSFVSYGVTRDYR